MTVIFSFRRQLSVLLAGFLPGFFCPLSGLGATANVSVGNDFFSPVTTKINVGDQVIWSWESGSVSHNVVSTSSPLAWLFPSPGGGPGTSSNQNDSNLRNYPFSFTNTFDSAGSFPYECTEHVGFGMVGTVTVTAAKPAPTVSLTNPVAGAVFAAPANLKLGATAAVSSGTVTNVAFFAGTNLLGSVQTSPFNITGSSLGAGSYSLTAVATAAGISATSAVVSITVVLPVAVSNSAPTVANDHFTFSYTANPGLAYVVENSSNLVNWVSISTNVAASSSVVVTNAFVPANGQFYRVGRVPNP
jgi:plastocyanin